MPKGCSGSLFVTAVLCFAAHGTAQERATAPFELYGGYSALTNSFNGLPGSRQPLQGWDASAAFPAWRNLRFKIDVAHYSGRNSGAQQRAVVIMGGGQYEHMFGWERVFAQALFGDAGLNRYWGANALPGMTASFSALLGGGADTPLGKHFALHVEAGMQHTNFALIQSVGWAVPYRIPGLPTYFGRYSAGLQWEPVLKPEPVVTSRIGNFFRDAPESEIAFEDLNSFGHYDLYGSTWWSYLHVAGFEYDRHSWGTFIGARLDYVAELLPVVILNEPSDTDVWGNPHSPARAIVPGVGIAPIGMRMMWGDGKRWKPYYTVKGGMLGFTRKVLSQYASYEDFSLQNAAGFQFRINDRWEFRAAISDFHFSNGFLVPSNPGIDEMAWSGGFTYRLGGNRSASGQ
jgi:hypothetical protein